MSAMDDLYTTTEEVFDDEDPVSYFDDEEFLDGYKRAMEDADVQFVDDCHCVHNAKVFGIKDSIRRAKFPMATNTEAIDRELTSGIKALAQCDKGSGHDQWLTGVIVQFDLTFSNKAWVEAERYHFLDFVSSQSTMHRIATFDLDEQYNEYVDKRIVDIMKEKVSVFNKLCDTDADAKSKNEAYLDILYNNPSGFLITAGMTTNYRQLKTIYSQRKGHRLPEWREFCKWIETLPMSELITDSAPLYSVSKHSGGVQ